ncbi:MAG: shikimate dehydrogenase [Cryomorphaceae bacterium]|nr:shikimate dehydrogenase [Cryomorphaceae bacterium]
MQLGLIGYPLTHSFSPNYFSEKFLRENLVGYTYKTFPIPDISLFPELLHKHPKLSGLNVTIPYKEQIIPYLDEVHKTAMDIGAVNTITINQDGITKGYNTDVIGFLVPIKKHIGQIRSALVLGTGGASKAVVYALHNNGIHVQIVSRTPTDKHILSYDDLEELGAFDLIVNCTPIGMYPNETNYPQIPYDKLNSKQTLYDLVYNPAETVFLREGNKHGCKTINGYPMLVAQARASWDIWINNKH